MGVTDIGRRSETFLEGLTLGTDDIITWFHALWGHPVESDRLRMWDTMGAKEIYFLSSTFIFTDLSSFLSVGDLPASWKLAAVTLYLQKGASSRIENYRPASIAGFFCKLMERIIARSMSAYVLTVESQLKHQRGFLNRKFTTTNVL